MPIKKTGTTTLVKKQPMKRLKPKPVTVPTPLPHQRLNETIEPTTSTTAGLGDIIKIVTTAVGIEQCDKCKERQAQLNKAFPFTKVAKELTDDNILFLKRIRIATTIGSSDRKEIFDLYNRVLSKKLMSCSCPGIIMQILTELWNVYLANHSNDINE